MRQITLKQAVDLVRLIKSHDYNDEYNVYLDVPTGKIVVESKIIVIKEVENV